MTPPELNGEYSLLPLRVYLYHFVEIKKKDKDALQKQICRKSQFSHFQKKGKQVLILFREFEIQKEIYLIKVARKKMNNMNGNI